MEHSVTIGEITLGTRGPFFLIAGPCVIENEETTLRVAGFLKEIAGKLNIPIIFKSSYDKANRTSLASFRGPGIQKGLEILNKVKETSGLPVISDVHGVSEVETAAKVLDVLQIPALLCRQTDLIVAAARSGRPINIKKGQFISPYDVFPIVEKATSVGNRHILVTERGSFFGYNNLVVDMRSIPILRESGFPLVFDATHSVQLPGGQGICSGGQREFVGPLSRAAIAAGADGIFMEIHPNPDAALCDGPNSLPLGDVEPLLRVLKDIHGLVRC